MAYVHTRSEQEFFHGQGYEVMYARRPDLAVKDKFKNYEMSVSGYSLWAGEVDFLLN
jgi:hypothetical protein